jgi:sarcosine oxidase, subunit alpha
MKSGQPFRLANGGRIDRNRSIRFTCNGRRLVGYAGDTVASALMANGVRIVGRSFKYHRPRGILSAGVEEPNAIFRIDTGTLSVPLVRATLQPLVEGLVATTENAYPSLHFDLGRLLDFTHGLWPAGFYHKTFMWPSWHWYENLIRRSAGSGRLSADADPTAYFQHNLHCDVLIVGAGPAGLSAALAATQSRARVVLIEQEPALGGTLLYDGGAIDGASAESWREGAAAELATVGNVRILTSTTVVGYYDHNVLMAVDRSDATGPDRPIERLWKIRARQVVLATGSIEQPLVFGHNDRPNIMLAGAVRRYLTQFAVAAGHVIVVATNSDDAYRTAFVLQDAGIKVPAIVDSRQRPSDPMTQEARQRGLKVIGNSVIVDTAGRPAVAKVAVGELSADGRSVIGRSRWLTCDALAMSGGPSPTLQLYSQAGGRLRFRDDLCCFVPDGCRQHVRVAGAANGSVGLAEALAEGTDAGAAAARDSGFDEVAAAPARSDHRIGRVGSVRRAPGGTTSRQWVDFHHDVTVADIALAARENYVSVEHLKRYTTVGMSIDQGKTSNLNALSVLATLTERTIPEVGTTTFRPMFSPVSMGAITAGTTGDQYSPVRLLAAHDWHVGNGAEFENYGMWQRPSCYRKPGETRANAIAREVHAVRHAIGLFDATPLGKIEVKGPDAAEFLNRIYVNNMLTLQPGKVRYGLMLNENGIVLDDGVAARLAPDHYLVSTTSGNADRITDWLEEWHQCEWPHLNVVLSPVTSQWAVLTVAGPRARELLASLESDIDFSGAAFPHMAIRSGRLAGVSVRVQRVSYSGEVSFEISVPACSARGIWEACTPAGASSGIEPIGIEAILVLRLEKGFLHVGTDTDGTTNPLDVGFGSIIGKKSGDFVGRRSLMRANDARPDRRQLVGLEPLRPLDCLIAGAHLICQDGGVRRSEGFVTSACRSPTLQKSIGLGLLENGFRRRGDSVTVFDNGGSFEARVVEPLFYDPKGERLRA